MTGMPLTTHPTKVRQIVARIEAEIRAGVLRPGRRLLPKAALCARFGAGGAVVNAAYAQLEAKGLIVRSPRSGVVVSPEFRSLESRLVGVLTSYTRSDIENYFEPLLRVAAARRTVVMTSAIGAPNDWRLAVGDMMARSPDAVLVDVEGRRFPLDELGELIGAAPTCFVNRWDWVPRQPERAVLVDYTSSWTDGLRTLLERGHERILQVFHHRHLQPHVRNMDRFARKALGVAKDDPRLATISQAAMQEAPEAVKKLVAEFKPTAIRAGGDYLLVLLEELCPETARLERIGMQDSFHARRPGREFSSFRVDFAEVWSFAFDSFAGAPEVVTVKPRLVERWPTARPAPKNHRKRHEAPLMSHQGSCQ